MISRPSSGFGGQNPRHSLVIQNRSQGGGHASMEKDIFGQEAKILAAAKKTMEEGGASPEAYNDLVSQYGKLLRTTKKIIKLSDKNEQRLNELKREAQETNTQLEGMSSQLSKFPLHSFIIRFSLVQERVLASLGAKSSQYFSQTYAASPILLKAWSRKMSRTF